MHLEQQQTHDTPGNIFPFVSRFHLQKGYFNFLCLVNIPQYPLIHLAAKPSLPDDSQTDFTEFKWKLLSKGLFFTHLQLGLL
jgi:hypothetical protein